MAIKRSDLEAKGLTAEQVEFVVGEHIRTVNAIKDERDELRAKADKLAEAQRQLEAANKQVEDLKKAGGDAAKVQAEFDAYKQHVEAAQARAAKDGVFDRLLADGGVANEQARRLIREVYDTGKLEVKDGKAVNGETVLAELKAAYGTLFGKPGQQGTDPLNPPGNPGQMTREAFGKLPLDKQMAYANEHPAEYASMK